MVNGIVNPKNTQSNNVKPDKNGIVKGPQQMSPKMQKQFDMFVINGLNIIHDDEMAQSILSKVMNQGDPIGAIAELTVNIVLRIIESAEQKGLKLAKDIIVHGGNILMGEIINLAESAGMQKLTQEERLACWQMAVSMFIDTSVKSGKMSKEQLIHEAHVAKDTPEGQKIIAAADKGMPEQTPEQPATGGNL